LASKILCIQLCLLVHYTKCSGIVVSTPSCSEGIIFKFQLKLTTTVASDLKKLRSWVICSLERKEHGDNMLISDHDSISSMFIIYQNMMGKG